MTLRSPAANGSGLLPMFDAPSMLEDLDPEHRTGWSEVVSEDFDRARKGDERDPFNHPRSQFFNATKEPIGSDHISKEISWRAFPRQVQVSAPGDESRWRQADSSRDEQDEYCEWSVNRDENGKITRVTFTCEGPEYWEYLSNVQPDTVLQLYKQHVNPLVKRQDIFDRRGNYIPQNKWNRDTTNGAMHLIQVNNTLGAEIELAAGASIVRLDSAGRDITDVTALINCGSYGAPERYSDPHIGSEVNELARLGALITLQNPVGLYFDSFSPSGFVTPDRTDAAQFWTWTRGQEGYRLRGVFEVPAGKPYKVGDISIQGKGKIRYGSMLVDYIRIKLVGLACNIDRANRKPVQGCVGQTPSVGKIDDGLNESEFESTAAPLLDISQTMQTRGHGVSRLCSDAASKQASKVAGLPDIAQTNAAVVDNVPPQDARTPEVFEMLVGRNEQCIVISEADKASLLKDPFATIVLGRLEADARPQSLDDVVKVIKGANEEGSFVFHSFLVGDGGQIGYGEAPDLKRNFRFIWTRSPKPSSSVNASPTLTPILASRLSDIMAVSGAETDSSSTFLQVAAWDEQNGYFNYYARVEPGVDIGCPPGSWVWHGNSLHAFAPDTRGKGVFDGHVSGSLVMKELRAPWNNWNSSAAAIDSAIGPDDPLRRNPLFQTLSDADILETAVIAPGISAWCESRLTKAIQMDGSILGGPKLLLQHLFDTTTVNFISSPTRSKQTVSGNSARAVKLPWTFFFNATMLSKLEVAVDGLQQPQVDYSVYADLVGRYGLKRVGYNSNGEQLVFAGDTFFAFFVPEPSEEDNAMIQTLIGYGLISRRFATCVLMVDFANPIYSTAREALMEFVPDTALFNDLEETVVNNILSARSHHPVAQEFAKWWDVEPQQLTQAASQELTNYLVSVSNNISQGVAEFDPYFRLAESRRREFQGSRLNEFSLTLPLSNIPENSPLLQMTASGSITEKPNSRPFKLSTDGAKKGPAGSMACSNSCSTVVQGGRVLPIAE
eukprot:jgi/Chrzof1/184/Cz01g06080.t1